ETMNMAFWQTLLEVRAAVSKQLEKLRADKTIGSSLDAEVTLYVDAELQTTLRSLKHELRFVLITSAAELKDINDANESAVKTTLDSGKIIKVNAIASTETKCVRCWHHRNDVGKNAEHPELCGRCVENVAGDGEQRLFA
ncbi:MAG: zinc finger domain-containing protein, partial [Gammaproteobacteria bacterium]|nr:zinc finger domain-containing protein [Gammaproteobacteria bacterium]